MSESLITLIDQLQNHKITLELEPTNDYASMSKFNQEEVNLALDMKNLRLKGMKPNPLFFIKHDYDKQIDSIKEIDKMCIQPFELTANNSDKTKIRKLILGLIRDFNQMKAFQKTLLKAAKYEGEFDFVIQPALIE